MDTKIYLHVHEHSVNEVIITKVYDSFQNLQLDNLNPLDNNPQTVSCNIVDAD